MHSSSRQDLQKEIVDLGLRIGKHEKKIRLLESQQVATESILSEFEGIRDRTPCFRVYGSPGKCEIRQRIQCQNDSAAAFLMKLLENMSHRRRQGLIGNIIGVVALLGTLPTLELSRIFAEYLGDQMLAVVCKSYNDLHLLERYEKNGKLNREHALHMSATQLGQSINGRYHVLCLEEIRPCKIDKDGKLLLSDPKLPDGSTPKGFLGYAANMIEVDVDYLSTKTDSGCGLRETLFYRLFGELQVYESREDMEKAIPCIKDGAVSLDGGILRGDGAVYLGGFEPDVVFPVAAASSQVFFDHDMQVLKEVRDELVREKKSKGKTLEKLKKRHGLYVKYFT